MKIGDIDVTSVVSAQSYEPLDGNLSTDVTVIGFKMCAASSFQLDTRVASNWLGNSKSVQDGKIEEVTVKLNDLKKSLVLRDLKLRNMREHRNVDKISVNYVNVTFWEWNKKINTFGWTINIMYFIGKSLEFKRSILYFTSGIMYNTSL